MSPAPTGWGVPQPGDRSARDTHNYADLHASDIEEGEHTVHNPWPLAAGEAAVSDGTQMQPVDIATQAELDAHAGTADAHHDPVTLSAEAADVLALLGQEIDLDTQAPNVVFAGPASGADAAPTFRALVAADLGTGTPDGTKYLRDDLTWQFVEAGGGGASGTPAGYAETIGDAVNTVYTVTHSLASLDVVVQVYDLDATPIDKVDPQIEVLNANAVQITFLEVPAEDQYRVLVLAVGVVSPADFVDLNDTPASYVGQGGKYVAVKVSEDGLEFL
jgi:hypothetical protein